MGYYDRYYKYENASKTAERLVKSGSAPEFKLRLAIAGKGFTAEDLKYMASNVCEETAAALAEAVEAGAFDDVLAKVHFEVDYYIACAENRKAVNPDHYVKFDVLQNFSYGKDPAAGAAVMNSVTRRLYSLYGRQLKSVDAFRGIYVTPYVGPWKKGRK